MLKNNCVWNRIWVAVWATGEERGSECESSLVCRVQRTCSLLSYTQSTGKAFIESMSDAHTLPFPVGRDIYIGFWDGGFASKQDFYYCVSLIHLETLFLSERKMESEYVWERVNVSLQPCLPLWIIVIIIRHLYHRDYMLKCNIQQSIAKTKMLFVGRHHFMD